MAVGIRADIPSDITKMLVCIDRLQDGEIYGRCYNPYYSTNPKFIGLAALIGRMEFLFDRLSYPQRTLEPRKFRVRMARRRIPDTGEGGMLMEEPKGKETPRGEKATFVVNVQFRQNATWQGTVDWLCGGEPDAFSSDLEFLKLVERHIAAL